MTWDNFLSTLKNTPGVYWELNKYGGIRGRYNGVIVCPLTLVARTKIGDYVSIAAPINAARALGMTPATFIRVTAAIDNALPLTGDREALLKIVGL